MLKLSPALLKAMAEKLIPGIPQSTRVAILQQTDQDADAETNRTKSKTVLEQVVDGDNLTSDMIRKADCNFSVHDSNACLKLTYLLQSYRRALMWMTY